MRIPPLEGGGRGDAASGKFDRDGDCSPDCCICLCLCQWCRGTIGFVGVGTTACVRACVYLNASMQHVNDFMVEMMIGVGA